MARRNETVIHTKIIAANNVEIDVKKLQQFLESSAPQTSVGPIPTQPVTAREGLLRQIGRRKKEIVTVNSDPWLLHGGSTS